MSHFLQPPYEAWCITVIAARVVEAKISFEQTSVVGGVRGDISLHCSRNDSLPFNSRCEGY
nr:MAG TPA: hypothetical protein [Caudoviricetes sp.]DAW68579.1 MAG TPA: hypothetical protein [Caudoviricetes sp.]